MVSVLERVSLFSEYDLDDDFDEDLYAIEVNLESKGIQNKQSVCIIKMLNDYTIEKDMDVNILQLTGPQTLSLISHYLLCRMQLGKQKSKPETLRLLKKFNLLSDRDSFILEANCGHIY